MSRIRGGVLAAVVAALAIGGAGAQTPPADPFAPGAAADNAAPEAAKTTATSPPDAAKATATSPPETAEKTAPRRAKPKPRPAEGGAIRIVVDNKRLVGLVQLTIGPAGGEGEKVAGPLAFGRKVSVHVKRTKDCLYDVRAHFADEADTEQLGVDLCKDKVINLTDE